MPEYWNSSQSESSGKHGPVRERDQRVERDELAE